MVARMVTECESPAFSHKEYQQMRSFKEEIINLSAALVFLTADGVEEYLDSYRCYVSSLELQYQHEILQYVYTLTLGFSS